MSCRICKATTLIPILDLGLQFLTGVFPKKYEDNPIASPLKILFCSECRLVQLENSVDPKLMYGDNYGYQSGINSAMKFHLERKVDVLAKKFDIHANSIILDIGSNDGTSCNYWLKYSNNVTGIDPTALKFLQNYDKRIRLVTDFFNSEKFLTSSKKADVITSIAMFYDLEDPVKFAQEISESLSDNGIWHLEQSYLLSMVNSNAYDTICHEHLEYDCLSRLNTIMHQAGLRIIDASLNDVNGGSIAITVAKKGSIHQTQTEVLQWLMSKEDEFFSEPINTLGQFAVRVKKHRNDLHRLVSILSKKYVVGGLGASTKGNVLLQYCGFSPDQIQFIVDVNSEKWGRETPGTRIPIVGESELFTTKVDFLIVFPWHFRQNLLSKAQPFFASGGKYIFPLPEIEMIS